MHSSSTTSRRLSPLNSGFDSRSFDFNRWAIIIGISQYKYEDWNLSFADRDAEEIYNFLLTPGGGEFQPDHVCKLINEQATQSSITKAFRSFLKKPKKEDLVIIYLACHGTPDIERLENVYLIAHDTSFEDIAGTGVPMYEIDYQLRHTLSCDKAVILADTCHSGAIGGSIGRGGIYDNSRLVNKYLERVSKARSGIALFTSSQANQLSEEHEKWGGGHGVFTHFILEGMKGKADIDQDGVVTVGELFEYVRENVKNETNNRQCPLIGSNYFDSKLPLSIVQSSSNNFPGRLLVATIGISNYRYSHIWQPIERAVNDSRAFKEMLMHKHHFLEPSNSSSLLDEEATKYNILTFVDSLRSSVHREDSLVFFFSGYTYTHIDEVGSQKIKTGFLVPADVREPKYCRIDCIEIDSFLKSISVIPAKHIFVVINSSSDGISLGEITKTKSAIEESSLDSPQKISRVVMISTGDGEFSLQDLSDEPSLSLFAKAFLFCLSEPKEEWISQGYVTCSQMISCLKSRVVNLSENKQNPNFSTFFLDQNGKMVIPLDHYDNNSDVKEDDSMKEFLKRKQELEYALKKLELEREIRSIESQMEKRLRNS